MRISTRISLIMSVLWTGTVYITVITDDELDGGDFYPLTLIGIILLWSLRLIFGKYLDKELKDDP